MSSADSRALQGHTEGAAHSTCPGMTPCSRYSSVHHHALSERLSIKRRKPVVEKMRRDRINSCIEQLRILLEKEFHKQEPNSKLDKADILEMTVSFLRQQLQPGLSHKQGYCLQDRRQRQQLPETQRTSGSSPVCLTPASMWRPW